MRRWLATYKPLVGSLLRQAWLPYVALALLVLAPLLKSGYILTLDMVFTPHLRMPTTSSNDYLLRVLLHTLNVVLPSDVIEKLLLFLVLLLSGVGVHRLVQYVNRTDRSVFQEIGAYVGGILYTLNPFTYDRFMAGQYEVLLGYALLPWFVLALLRFLAYPGWTRVLRLLVFALLISIVSIHSIGLMIILTIVMLGTTLWQRRSDGEWRMRTLRLGLLVLGLFVVMSSYWVVPLVLGKGSVAAQVAAIGASDQSAFATVGGGVLGKIGNIVRLQGFWVEARNMYDLPQAHVPAWRFISLIVWALVVAGAISLWRSRRRAVVAVFALSALIGCLVALGALSGLAAHSSLFAGYREPEKFVALVALACAVLAARGAASASAYFQAEGGKVFGAVAAVLLLAVPFVWTPTMLLGFNGQLKSVQYPADWQTVNALLNSEQGNFQTLFLPWHLYMRFGFVGRIIASPAPGFFDKPVLVSDNPEFRGAALAKSTPAKRTLDSLLPNAEHTDDLGAQLAKLHVQYIILSHDDDYRQYDYLVHRADMQLITKGATLDVYRNKAYRGE